MLECVSFKSSTPTSISSPLPPPSEGKTKTKTLLLWAEHVWKNVSQNIRFVSQGTQPRNLKKEKALPPQALTSHASSTGPWRPTPTTRSGPWSRPHRRSTTSTTRTRTTATSSPRSSNPTLTESAKPSRKQNLRVTSRALSPPTLLKNQFFTTHIRWRLLKNHLKK